MRTLIPYTCLTLNTVPNAPSPNSPILRHFSRGSAPLVILGYSFLLFLDEPWSNFLKNAITNRLSALCLVLAKIGSPTQIQSQRPAAPRPASSADRDRISIYIYIAHHVIVYGVLNIGYGRPALRAAGVQDTYTVEQFLSTRVSSRLQ